MGRQKKHDWSDKRDICHKLVIEEGKSTREVIQYFAEALGVPESELPIPGAFRRQFKEWGFPAKKFKPTPEETEQIVSRIRGLWQQNCDNAYIANTIRNEGFPELSDTAIGAIRRKHGLLLRNSTAYQSLPLFAAPASDETGNNPSATETSFQDVGGDSNATSDAAAAMQMFHAQQQHMNFSSMSEPLMAEQPTAPAIAQFPRSGQRTLAELQEKSDELFQTRKRRRRLIGRGMLPPDAPGLPPRYKSETTLDECKAFLQLDNDAYANVRQHYMNICTDMGIIKKTLCHPGVWDASKDRLIRENVHVATVMNAPHPEADKVANALEVVCSDVTKKMRVLNSRVTMADANNGLQLNPTESKQVRLIFYEMLVEDGFTTRMECGEERWDRLYQNWLGKTPTLIRIRDQGIDEEKRKFLAILMRDAMKRLNDGRLKNHPAIGPRIDPMSGPGPGPMKNQKLKGVRGPKTVLPTPRGPARRSAPAAAPVVGTSNPPSSPGLDPALFAALTSPPAPTVQIPAYFRLAPTSHLIGHHAKMWLGKLNAVTMEALHAAATSKAGAAKVGKVHGIVKTATPEQGGERMVLDGATGEDSYLIDGNDELEAYLETAKDTADGKVVFVVELNGGYA